jgi:hypothetical protein
MIKPTTGMEERKMKIRMTDDKEQRYYQIRKEDGFFSPETMWFSGDEDEVSDVVFQGIYYPDPDPDFQCPDEGCPACPKECPKVGPGYRAKLYVQLATPVATIDIQDRYLNPLGILLDLPWYTHEIDWWEDAAVRNRA